MKINSIQRIPTITLEVSLDELLGIYHLIGATSQKQREDDFRMTEIQAKTLSGTYLDIVDFLKNEGLY